MATTSASSKGRIALRIVVVAAVLMAVFYLGRPLYWKISATIQDILHNKRTVQQGISDIVYEAHKSVVGMGGWFHDESDSGRAHLKTSRRTLLFY